MSRCEEEFDGHRRGGREKEEARKKKRRRKKEEEGEKEEIERGSREREKGGGRKKPFPHAVISSSKQQFSVAQCVNESSVKPFLFRKSNIYACSTDTFKRSLCTVSFPNR